MMALVRQNIQQSAHFHAFPPALQRDGTPAEVASLISFLLGDESQFITGSEYRIDGGRLC